MGAAVPTLALTEKRRDADTTFVLGRAENHASPIYKNNAMSSVDLIILCPD